MGFSFLPVASVCQTVTTIVNWRNCRVFLAQTSQFMDLHVLVTLHISLWMIFKEDPKKKLCTEKPTSVWTFASFIIDLKSVNHKDLAADDNGVWVTSGPRRMYELKWQRGAVQSLK